MIRERERDLWAAWTVGGVALGLLAMAGLSLLAWPIEQLYRPEPWLEAAQRRPAGLSRAWLEHCRDYLGTVLPHWDRWWPTLRYWLWSEPVARTGMPAMSLVAMWGLGVSVLTLALANNPYDPRPKAQGSARWGTPRDLRADQLTDVTGIVLGRKPVFDKPDMVTSPLRYKWELFCLKWFGATYIRNWETLSGIMLAPPGTGKTVQLVTSILADWPDRVRGPLGRRPAPVPGPSMVVNDPKGEIFSTTAWWRVRVGKVYRLAWGETDDRLSHSFNPIGFDALPGGKRSGELREGLLARLGTLFGEDRAATVLANGLTYIRDHGEVWRQDLWHDPSLVAPRGTTLDPATIEAFRRAAERPAPTGRRRRRALLDMLGLGRAPTAAGPPAEDGLFEQLVELQGLQAGREKYIDRLCTVCIPETVEQHWKVNGREFLAGAINYIIARAERLGFEPTFGALLDWLTSTTRGGDFTDLAAHPTGEATETVDADGRVVSGPTVKAAGAPPNASEGGDADNDLTARVLDQALEEARQFGYPQRCISDLQRTRMQPDRERGSTISTAGGAISIFKNAAVRARTGHSSFRLEDLRGRNGRPVTVYLDIALEDAEFLGRVTGLFMEAAASFLISQPESVAKTRRPVIFWLDEFWTMPPLQVLKQIPALGRGQRVVAWIVGQSFGQIGAKYKQDSQNTIDELKDATSLKVTATQASHKSAKEVSDGIGQTTRREDSRSQQKGFGQGVNPFSWNVSSRHVGVPLARPEQIMSMEKFDPRKRKLGLILVQLSGAMARPFLCRPAAWFFEPALRRRVHRTENPQDIERVLYPETTADAPGPGGFHRHA